MSSPSVAVRKTEIGGPGAHLVESAASGSLGKALFLFFAIEGGRCLGLNESLVYVFVAHRGIGVVEISVHQSHNGLKHIGGRVRNFAGFRSMEKP